MNEYHTKKILLVDDDNSILNLLEIVLKKEQFQNIHKSKKGLEAVKICNKIKPDIVVLDIMLPDIDGIEVCRRIRQSSMVPILFLSAKSEEIDKLLSFGMGGDSYITKPFSPKEVIANIQSILRRMSFYEQVLSENRRIYLFGAYKLDLDKKELYKNNENVLLTAKEYHLLEYLVSNSGTTISREKLIEKVWDTSYEGYDNTVMVHIRRLREKIEAEPSNPVYIITVKGRGYRFIPPSMECNYET